MTGSPALNTMNAPKWAAVVSGTVWKRWGVSPVGTLEAEYVRGPLIVWAKPGSGEEEDAPKIEAPKPDALALRVVELNTARQWEKVGQAARWKVRASVRWKTPKRIRRQVSRKQIVLIEGKYLSLSWIFSVDEKVFGVGNNELPFEYGFKDPSVWASADRFMLGMFSRRRRVEIAKERREQKSMHAFRLERERKGYVSPEPLKLEGEEKEKRLEEIRELDERLSRILRALDRRTMPDAQDLRDMAAEQGDALISLMRFFGPKFGGTDGLTYAALFRLLRELTGFKSIKDSLLLRGLEAAEYLAHVRRRAKPAPRRSRVPRPLYARPRPPSAPLAPPVTC